MSLKILICRDWTGNERKSSHKFKSSLKSLQNCCTRAVGKNTSLTPLKENVKKWVVAEEFCTV